MLSRAAPMAYGSSQARGWIGAIAASLHHSHSNAGSGPCLWPTPQLMATPDPRPTEQGHRLNYILMDIVKFISTAPHWELPRFYYFRTVLSSWKIEKKVQRFPIYPFPLLLHSHPISNILHQSGTLVITDEPTPTHHSYPESIVHLRVLSWCCIFYRFGQIYNDMYLSL